jgi:hypothetical protein
MSGEVRIRTILSEDGNSVLQSLPNNFSYVVVGESEGTPDPVITIRSSIKNIPECTAWLKDFQQNTLTRWIIARATNEPTRYAHNTPSFPTPHSLPTSK